MDLYLTDGETTLPVICLSSTSERESSAMVGTTTRQNNGWRSSYATKQQRGLSGFGYYVTDDENPAYTYNALVTLKRQKTIVQYSYGDESGSCFIDSLELIATGDDYVLFNIGFKITGAPIGLIPPTNNLYKGFDVYSPPTEEQLRISALWYSTGYQNINFYSETSGDTDSGLYSGKLTALTIDENNAIRYSVFGLDPTKTYNFTWNAKSANAAGDSNGSAYVQLAGASFENTFIINPNWTAYARSVQPTAEGKITLSIIPSNSIISGGGVGQSVWVTNIFGEQAP